MVSWTRADVVILTAIELEYAAVKQVDAGAAPGTRWAEEKHNGLPVALREFIDSGGRRLRIAVGRAPDMGKGSALTTLQPLVDAMRPACIAMCGVCAGRPGKTALGDVVVGERLYDYDAGKRTEEFSADVRTYSLPAPWKIAAEQFDPKVRFGSEDWWRRRPVPYEWQEAWVLAKLHEGVENPAALPEREDRCPQWPTVIERLRDAGYLTGNKPTPKGKKRAEEAAFQHPLFPDLSPGGEFMPFQLHVRPIGSGSAVREDVEVWGFVTPHMRTALALEMEASALADLVRARTHHAPIDAVVMKGVMDFANHGRDDHFKHYAARASAECLIAFLRDQLRGGRDEAVAQDLAADTKAPPVQIRMRSTPTLATAEPSPPEPTSLAIDIAACVQEYRLRKSGYFERWDESAPGVAASARNRPSSIRLDDMYLAPRFIVESDPAEPPDAAARAVTLEYAAVAGLSVPRVLVGGAGSGKSTWVRHVFRGLLRDEATLPLVLELRALAANWKSNADARRPIVDHLVDELRSHSGDVVAGSVLRALLTQQSAPRPVVLVDGWDELGLRGDVFRAQLVEFHRQYPRAVIVVTSRPYGDSRPAGGEGFETYLLQPLELDEIRALSGRILHHAYGETGEQPVEVFMAELRRSPRALALAATPLLLRMMLRVRRKGPLPERLSKLYEACIGDMLGAGVDERAERGAQPGRREWCPDEQEARLAAAAELAFRLQERSSGDAPSIVFNREDAGELLGSTWTRTHRAAFVEWLLGSAGVLVDQSDESMMFAHLGFQEYLALQHLLALNGEVRYRAARVLMAEARWTEVLRLWTEVTAASAQRATVPGIGDQHADCFLLAGHVLAQGLGDDADFQAWLATLPAVLAMPAALNEPHAVAWRTSPCAVRKQAVADRLTSEIASERWLAQELLTEWCDLAGLVAATVGSSPAQSFDELSVGRSRARFGVSPLVPETNELALLRLWPSVRASIGVRLQTMISVGASRLEVSVAFRDLFQVHTRSWSAEDLAYLAVMPRWSLQYLDQHPVAKQDPDFVRRLANDAARECFLYFGRESRAVFGRYFGQSVSRGFVTLDRNPSEGYFVSYPVRDFVRSFKRYPGRSSVVGMAGRQAQASGLSVEVTSAPWWPAFAVLEKNSIAGRASMRAAVASLPAAEEDALLALFRISCKASFAPDDEACRRSVASTSAGFTGDPLWDALARHIARASTPADHALLEARARTLLTTPSRLSWGLQYLVRGDLIFDDGSTLTLDALCAEHGLPPLALLDEMPIEIPAPL